MARARGVSGAGQELTSTWAIFIDWDGTLNKQQFWQAWRGDSEFNGTYDLIEQTLFVARHRILNEWMTGKVSAEQVCELLGKETGIRPNKLLDELKASCEAMTIEPSALAVIKKARAAGYKVYVATDNMDTFTRWTVPALKLFDDFDGVYSSYEVGHLKREIDDRSNSIFFQTILSGLSLNPRKVIMIDDSSDTRIIESMGMKFEKIDNPTGVAAVIEEVINNG